MRSAMLGVVAARPHVAAPAAAAAGGAPAMRPRVLRRRCMRVAAAAEAGSDAPAVEVQSFATTAPLRVRGMDGKLSAEVRSRAGQAAASGAACSLHACGRPLLVLSRRLSCVARSSACMHVGNPLCACQRTAVVVAALAPGVTVPSPARPDGCRCLAWPVCMLCTTPPATCSMWASAAR